MHHDEHNDQFKFPLGRPNRIEDKRTSLLFHQLGFSNRWISGFGASDTCKVIPL